MTITIAGYTDAKSATVSSRGVLNSYFYDPNLSTFTTLLSGTNAQSFLSTENWITSGGIPAATQNPQNSSYWTLGPAGNYPFEGKAKGRYGLVWTASSDLVSPLGVDALNFTSQNYNITYGFDPTLTMTAGYGTGTIITVASTVNLQPGYIVSVSSGTGAFSANTYVTGVLSLTQFTVNTAPSVALSNASVLASATGTLTGTSSSSGTTINVTSGTTAGLVIGSVVYTKTASTTGYFTAATYVTAVNSSTQFTVNTAPAVALSSATIGFNNGLIGWRSSTSNSATAATAFASAEQMGFGTYLTGATSTTTTVTVTSTANVYPGMYMVIRTGTGTIAAGTIVTGIAGPTTFTINNTPSVALSAATISLMYFPYAGASANYRFLAVDSNVMTSATAQGPLIGSSGPNSGWLVSYYDLATGAVNWLFSPELPMYASPFQSIYSRDANNFMLYGRTNTSANVSVSAALNIPAWVTSPTYSVATMTASAGASGTTITVQSIPPGLQINAPVSVSSGTGVFAAGTTITAINSSTTFTVSAAPTTPLVANDVILLANNTTNNGLPPGLSLNSSTGALSGTLDISSIPAGLNTYQFSLRCDFTFGSTGSASYNSGTGALGLTGSSTANMYYEVYDYSTSLQSVSLTNHNFVYGNGISPSTDPHRTSVIVIG